jgi:hypothetical protein
MPSIWYNLAKKRLMDGSLNLSSDTLKGMLVGSSYSPDPDHDFVDAGGANDPIDHEVDGTGYQKGHGGTGRKTFASKTFTESDANNNAVMTAASLAWTGIGPTTPISASNLLIIKPGTSDDTTALLIACIDVADITFNGTDYTVDPHATDGFLKLS